ncbi:hypothetical protein [Polycladidibacter hongkongensis]|uniref:hypothetical protein n=1 Tax=Polycladidibacter hongkongensis TaxID=1647556 RepID=UPI00082ABFA8|nr:hypothetical protein [Pseudovibrio hongkongensis]
MSKTIAIMHPGGLLLPGEVLGEEEVVQIDGGTPVEVPRSYGEHLIEDGLAFEVEDESDPEHEPDGEQATWTKEDLEAFERDELVTIAETFEYEPPANIKAETLIKKILELQS